MHSIQNQLKLQTDLICHVNFDCIVKSRKSNTKEILFHSKYTYFRPKNSQNFRKLGRLQKCPKIKENS